MSPMELDADRVAEETFRIFKQLATRDYSNPEVARLGRNMGDHPDPKLALYAADRLIEATARSLNVTGGAIIWSHRKLAEKVEGFYAARMARRKIKTIVGLVIFLALVALGIYWLWIK